jgi:PhzF family phenazine biosynthesis protein
MIPPASCGRHGHGMEVLRLAAFSAGTIGGNPAGVVVSEILPDPAAMQALAAEIGYSETVFAAPHLDGWRTRYFAPAMEIPFCGHATIALGAALTARHGEATFKLYLNESTVTVEGRGTGGLKSAALYSPPTSSEAATEDDIALALDLFSYDRGDLDARLPPAFIDAGARHLMLALSSRDQLARMRYDFEAGSELMRRWGLATIDLVHAETASRFHARNAFAAGGVYEDPATGAAAAAFAGYLGQVGWPHAGPFEIWQGDDMGTPCRLYADIPSIRDGSVRVSGTVRDM